ncbi:MAG TPA: hypothetical protein VGG19_13110 [Tepidisphaeraceae bacterium]
MKSNQNVNQKINDEYLRARTSKKRAAIIRKTWDDHASGKSGKALLEYYIRGLETVISHISVFSYSGDHTKIYRPENVFVGILYCCERLNDSLEYAESREIAELWPYVENACRGILLEEKDLEKAHYRRKLSHRAAQILLELWNNLNNPNDPGIYYAPELEDFAKALPYPVSSEMDVAVQVERIIANIKKMQMAD